MVGAERAQLVAEHAGGFLRCQLFAGGKSHKAAGDKAQSLYDFILDGRHKFGNAADDFAVFVIAEPVSFVAGLDLHLGAQSIDLFAGAGEVGNHDGLDHVALKRPEAAAGQQLRRVLHR